MFDQFERGEAVYAVACDLKWLVRSGAREDLVVQRPELTSRISTDGREIIRTIARGIETITEPVELPEFYFDQLLPAQVVQRALWRLLALNAVVRRQKPPSVIKRRMAAAEILRDASGILVDLERWRRRANPVGVEVQLMMVLAEHLVDDDIAQAA